MHKAHILQTWSPMSRPAGHLGDHNMSGQELGWNFCFARFPRPSFASHLNAMVVGQLRFLLVLECVKVFFLERCLKWSGPILDQSRRVEETVGSGATVAPPRSQGTLGPRISGERFSAEIGVKGCRILRSSISQPEAVPIQEDTIQVGPSWCFAEVAEQHEVPVWFRLEGHGCLIIRLTVD